MIYAAVIVAICLAELLIRRYINQNVEEDGQKWGKCGVRLRKYHNYGMANDTLRKRPMMVKIIGVVVVTFLAVVFLFLLTLKGEKAGKWGLALILGGGLANLLERFVHGYVTDYLQFRVPLACLRKLIYNVADLCIFAGTAILFFRELAEAVPFLFQRLVQGKQPVGYTCGTGQHFIFISEMHIHTADVFGCKIGAGTCDSLFLVFRGKQKYELKKQGFLFALHYFQAARPQQGKRKVGQILQMQRVQFFRFIVIRMERAVNGISGSLGDHCFLKQKVVTHAVL